MQQDPFNCYNSSMDTPVLRVGSSRRRRRKAARSRRLIVSPESEYSRLFDECYKGEGGPSIFDVFYYIICLLRLYGSCPRPSSHTTQEPADRPVCDLTPQYQEIKNKRENPITQNNNPSSNTNNITLLLTSLLSEKNRICWHHHVNRLLLP